MRTLFSTPRLTIIAWICLLWVFVAFCTLCVTIGELDVYGRPEWRPPYQWVVECAVFVGLAAIPIGFGSGGLALLLFLRKNEYGEFALALIPTLILGLLLVAFSIYLVVIAVHDYSNRSMGRHPPVVVPVSPD